MSLASHDWKKSYSSPEDNVVKELLIPALKEAILYERASGYFTSQGLLEITTGIHSLVENGGKIRMIISPNISSEDAEAITNGYKLRNERESVDQFLNKSFVPAKDETEREKYNILSHLIADGVLDIKVAVMRNNPTNGIFHDKLGIIEDKNGNILSFSGSMNETLNGFYMNHETIDVYFSLGPDYDRAVEKKERFAKYWNNKIPSIEVFDFPENLKARIDQYRKETIDWTVTELKEPKSDLIRRKDKNPQIPDFIKIRPYQEQAIDEWEKNGFRGLFDMATGTGKTITSIAAIVRLLDRFREKRKRLAIIIVVPYIHLVTQWMKDLERFHIQAITGYSAGNPKWREIYKREIANLNIGFKHYVCLITTNASFRMEKTQEIINTIRCDKLLVVDEAHNFGAPSLMKQLDNRFDYRLALSATIDRHFDKEGTNTLVEYFSPVCISYSLERAIEEGMLCEYEYYPVPVYLTQDELEIYEELSEKIGKLIRRDADGNPKKRKDGSIDLSPEAKMLLIKRARLIAGAKNKLEKLKEIVERIPDPDHMLVYCGATTLNRDDTDFSKPGQEEIRQIEAVTEILRKDFGLRTAKYTAEESNEERKSITRRFDEGDIQALAAIRCLDEGVDIPSIDKAIILASSTNPKEYIQRRGRVLRRAPGKDRAVIVDLVTLPDDVTASSYTNRPFDLGLVKRELKRVDEFGSASLNKTDSYELIDALEEKYGRHDLLNLREEFVVDE